MRPSQETRTYTCTICGGPARIEFVRDQQRLMCATCGPTHPAQSGSATPAERAPVTTIPPMATMASHTPAPPRMQPSGERRPRVHMRFAALLMSVVLVAALGLPLMALVYTSVSDWIRPPAEPEAPVLSWEAASFTGIPDEPADAAPASNAAAELPPPEIPEDLDVDPSLPAGTLPGEDAAETVAAQVAEDEAEAEIVTVGALRPDRVVVRLSSTPVGAQIGLDGTARGQTPAKLMLNPGLYELEVSLMGATALMELDASSDQDLCFAMRGRALNRIDCGA